MLTYARRKKLKQAKVGDPQDRISNLSDGILTHILSFVSTKVAVRTGILSTRWKSVWTSVPTLNVGLDDFQFEAERFSEDKEIKMRVRFCNFVERVLMNQSVPPLKKVNITGYDIDASQIESWICAAMKRKVHKLQLKFGLNEEIHHELPQSLFSCNTLVVLKLKLDMVLNFPVASVCFPNLKFLKLKSFIYKDDSSAQNLISSCPVLEDLVIVRKGWDDLLTLNVSSQSLKRLSMTFKLGEEYDHVQKIVIDTPALESINIGDNVTQDYVVRDLPSVREAKLDVSNSCSAFQEPANYATCLFELLRRISRIEFLSLSCSTMSSLSVANSYNLPTFNNLIGLNFVAIKDDWNWKLVLEFLKSSPVLEVLIFQGFSFLLDEEFGTSWSEWDVPNCLRSHLKIIKIMGFVSKDGVEKIRYFTENGKVLKKVTIKLKELTELLNLRKNSKACRIEFC